MADNFTTETVSTPDVTFASDDVAGVHYPIAKLAHGALDSATLVTTSSGLPVQQQGTFTVDLGATDNAVLDSIDTDLTTIIGHVDGLEALLTTIDADTSTLAGAVSGTEMQADIVTLPTTVHSADYDTGGGTDTTLAFGIAVPANGGAAVVPGDATAGLKVDLGADNDVTVTGTVTANLSAADNAVLDQIDANTDSLAVVGGGVEATALRVTIASDSTGVLSVDDGGGALTVDGTVTANLSATDNAVLDNIDADTSAIQTAVELIDDAVFADDAAFTTGSSKVMMSGAIRDDSLSTLTAVEGDAVPLRVNSTGALHVTGAGGGTQYNVDDAAGGTDTGTLTLAVRDDSLTTLTPADGDYVPLRVSSTGALHVTGGGGGTEYNEDAATPATITGTATMMERDDALATVTPIEGDWVSMRATAEGALWTQDFNSDAILAAVDGVEALLTTIDADTSNLSVVGGGTEAAAIRVTIANNSTGVLSVDDNGGSLTIDNANLTTIAGAVSGTEMQVDVVTSALPTGAATAANQTTIIGHVDGIEGLLTTIDADTGNAVTALQLIDDTVYTDDAAFTPGTSKVLGVGAQADETATDSVDEGDIGALRMTLTRLLRVVDTPHTSGGLTIFRSIDIDETEEEVKSSAGQLYFIHAINTTAAPLYLKFYNATAANTTVGTTTPILTFPVPGNADSDGAGFTVNIDKGLAFGTALSVACTTGVADNDTGAPGANACIINLGYA